MTKGADSLLKCNLYSGRIKAYEQEKIHASKSIGKG
jgi:hypothetical protein